jgi:PTH1 family peptidyl-tRNA hydrolase
MLLIAGLGNPGPAYAGHRHNIGFRVVERIAADHGFGPWRNRFKSEVAEGAVDGSTGGREKVLLMKPQTFMNNSGHAVGEAMRFHKLTASQVVAFYDELDLAPGRFRMKVGGGAAGHNGVRSIIAQAHPDIRRARIGIGHPGDKDRVLGHVLADFAKSEADWVEALLAACSRALPYLVAGDDERYQAEVMRLAPSPKADPRRPAAGDSDGA